MKWKAQDNLVLTDKEKNYDTIAECATAKIASEIVKRHNKTEGIDLFLRELQATDTDDYNVIRDRVAAIVEELEMEAAELTVFDIYELCSQIDEDVEGRYEEMHPNPPTFEIVPTDDKPRR